MKGKSRPYVPYVRKLGMPGNPTGRVGISALLRAVVLADGVEVKRRFFVARMTTGKRTRSRPFCIDTLGQEAAFRAAVRCRESWEREVGFARLAAEPSRSEQDKNYDKQYQTRYKADPARQARIRARAAAYKQRPDVIRRRRERDQQRKGGN